MSGLRERKKLSTRRAIQHAALGLYADRGFHATTIDELCERAEVARRTFFRYFSSKEDVVLGQLRADVEVASSVFAEASESEPLDALLTRAAAAVVVNPEMFAKFAEVVISVPELRSTYLGMLADFEDFLRGLVARRMNRGPGDERVRLAAAAAVAGYRVAVETWLAEQRVPDLFALLERNVTTMIKPLIEEPSDPVP